MSLKKLNTAFQLYTIVLKLTKQKITKNIDQRDVNEYIRGKK